MPLRHCLSPVHAWQSAAPKPHAVSTVPETHSLALLQHPSQFSGEHGACLQATPVATRSTDTPHQRKRMEPKLNQFAQRLKKKRPGVVKRQAAKYNKYTQAANDGGGTVSRTISRALAKWLYNYHA